MGNIGQKLKYARQNKELTQEAVMRLTGINRKSLSGYENNVAEPDLKTFATLVKLYGLSADTILELDAKAPSTISLSTNEQQFLNKLRKLDQQHLNELNALLDVLIFYSQHP